MNGLDKRSWYQAVTWQDPVYEGIIHLSTLQLTPTSLH